MSGCLGLGGDRDDSRTGRDTEERKREREREQEGGCATGRLGIKVHWSPGEHGLAGIGIMGGWRRDWRATEGDQRHKRGRVWYREGCVEQQPGALLDLSSDEVQAGVSRGSGQPARLQPISGRWILFFFLSLLCLSLSFTR